MSAQPLSLPDKISLSRVFLAGLFVLCFSDTDLFWFGIAIIFVLIALVSDFVDGHLARKNNVASFQGYMLDGMGDKVFYIAIYIVASRTGYLDLSLCFLLISRELILYVFRVIDVQHKQLSELRKYSICHAFFIRIFFLHFFFIIFFQIMQYSINIFDNYVQTTAWIALFASALGIRKQFQTIWLDKFK